MVRYDQRAMGQARLAQVLWLRGFVAQGVTQAQASLEQAQATGTNPTLCWVHNLWGPYSIAYTCPLTAG